MPGAAPEKSSSSAADTLALVELTRQQNQLLLQIVNQNQKVISRTEDILIQNQRLMQMLTRKRKREVQDTEDEAEVERRGSR